ncbi:class I SAM-dependent methyltransferase [Microbispora triticiradicis]|uniref:class I SAM-dependent methyltransferase n=1 Tax=Microbispora triticiradicis TaxID=2200763 RepID=UPI00244E3DA2|nr:class I SAM-dependent methyltransferase [Microbispora triticiradicis]MBO4271854.1 methyltransferase domain-containing protein [Microbispora triticiradicis]
MQDNIWSDFAKSYDQMIPELNCYQRMLRKILRDTEGRRTVIDAGCGTGLVSRALIDHGHEVIGFDNNAAMLRLARDKRAAAPGEARDRWTVMAGRVERFPSRVASDADAVVLINVLFYVRDAETALREAFSHLKPGGVMIATGPKRRPDLQKVLRHSIAEWQAEGRYTEALQAAVAHHTTCARRLTTDPNEMVTFFQVDELVETLRRLGYSRPLVEDGDDYYGENYYVCMQR